MRRIVSAAVVLLGLCLAAPVEANPEAVKKGVAAATAWLKLVDAGAFDKSWDQASTMIQKAITKEEWTKKMKSVQEMFGKLVSRKVTSTKYSTSLPGAPDGQYVVITFTTSFKKKEKAAESITPRLENGVWKVAGYFIK